MLCGVYLRSNPNTIDVNFQKSEILKLIEEKKYKLQETYLDEGDSRTNYKKLINDIRKNAFNLIITYDLSYLFKNITELFHSLKLFSTYSVHLISINNYINTQDGFYEKINPILESFNYKKRERNINSVREKQINIDKTHTSFSKLVLCGFCNKTMHIVSNSRHEKFFRCDNRARQGVSVCVTKYISLKELEKKFLTTIKNMNFETSSNYYTHKYKQENQKVIIIKELKELEDRRERLLNLHLNNHINQFEYLKKKNELEILIEHKNNELSAIKTSYLDLNQFRDCLNNLKENYDTLELASKNNLINKIVKNVVINSDKIEFKFLVST
jgi:hypothetical protein